MSTPSRPDPLERCPTRLLENSRVTTPNPHFGPPAALAHRGGRKSSRFLEDAIPPNEAFWKTLSIPRYRPPRSLRSFEGSSRPRALKPQAIPRSSILLSVWSGLVWSVQSTCLPARPPYPGKIFFKVQVGCPPRLDLVYISAA